MSAIDDSLIRYCIGNIPIITSKIILFNFFFFFVSNYRVFLLINSIDKAIDNVINKKILTYISSRIMRRVIIQLVFFFHFASLDMHDN